MNTNYNEPITFGSAGTARVMSCTGIDFFESVSASWTSAPVAELEVQLSPVRQDTLIELQAAPFLVPNVLVEQKVFIFFAGLFIGYCNFVRPDTKVFSINRGFISGRPMRLALILPMAASPVSLGLSEDMRELGIQITSIIFKTVS